MAEALSRVDVVFEGKLPLEAYTLNHDNNSLSTDHMLIALLMALK